MKLLDGATNLQSYVDDGIGHTKNWDEHIQTLRDFFERVKHGRLSLKPSKCKIGFGTVNQLLGTYTKFEFHWVPPGNYREDSGNVSTKNQEEDSQSVGIDKFLSSIYSGLRNLDQSAD